MDSLERKVGADVPVETTAGIVDDQAFCGTILSHTADIRQRERAGQFQVHAHGAGWNGHHWGWSRSDDAVLGAVLV